MKAVRITLLVGLLVGATALFVLPAGAQTYTYDGLPVGITGAGADGAQLRPTIQTTTGNAKPVINGRVASAGTVTITVGSQSFTTTADASGNFTATVPTGLAPGTYTVSFNGSVVGTLVYKVGATPSAPTVGSGSNADDGPSMPDLPWLPLAAVAAAFGVVGYFAWRNRTAGS